MKLTDERLFSQLNEYELDLKKNKRKEFKAADEIASLAELQANKDLAAFLEPYEYENFEAAGGSGLIVRIRFPHHNSTQVLKIPRAALLSPSASLETLKDAEDPEVAALSKLSHENIIRLYRDFEISQGRKLLISEWVSDSKELQDYVKNECELIEKTQSGTEISRLLLGLGELLQQVAKALWYMHSQAELFHFDVKPANILISHNSILGRKAYLIDLGLARDKAKYNPIKHEEIEVGFTWEYAHGKLLENIRSTIPNTKDKAKSFVFDDELDARYDLFAFGRTIQECLKVIRDYFGERANSDYAFSFLHMLAGLCLDGRAVSPSPPTKDYKFVEDISNGCGPELFAAHKFLTMGEVVSCLDRLLGRFSIERAVPELDPWYASTINASDIAQANLTPRVRRIIVNPFFKRLEREPQLGMLSEVFPTATHSRGNHSLGVYAAACRYICALYWDSENPICRILFTEDRVKIVLVASLIHDIGQTSFGHDIEELDEKIFSHSSFSLDILDRDMAEAGDLSKRSNTLTGAIEDPEGLGWGLKIIEVRKFLNEEGGLPIDALLRQIINGTIDADKLDYLIRDSVDCRVQYGHGIDVNRFLRSLTSIYIPKSKKRSFRLGLAIKAKGKASSDAFLLARLQMYKALYWHHTFRAIKAMFLTAAALTLESLGPKYQTENKLKAAVRAAYFDHVYLRALGLQGSGLPYISTLPVSDEPLSGEPLRYIGGSLADAAIDFFHQIGPPSARELLQSLVHRNIYKRLDEISFNDPNAVKLAARLKTHAERLKITRDLEVEFHRVLSARLSSPRESQYHFSPESAIVKFNSAWRPNITILVDAPLRVVDDVSEPVYYVSDVGRKYLRSGQADDAEVASTASSTQSQLRDSAFFRVFVKGDIHELILSHLTEADRQSALRAALFGIRV